MKKENFNLKLTQSQQAELAALASMPDAEINTEDIAEAHDWSDARRGVFFRPIKQQLTLRIDADVLAWFKNQTPRGRGYQTSINRALRDYVEQHEDSA